MSRKTEVREKTIETEVVITECDICHEQVSPAVDSVSDYDFNRVVESFARALDSHTEWWRKPLRKIVGIKKGVNHVTEDSDFDVHVECAYAAIKEKIEAAL